MSTVAIIGAGELGGAVAQALAARECVERITLIDTSEAVAAGKALDIQQSGAVDGFATTLNATGDMTYVTGTDVCVIADRVGRTGVEWEGDEGLSRLGRLAADAGDAPIVFAGARHAELMLQVSREARVPARRLVGSAPDAFASALRAIVAAEAQCSPKDVMLAVLGSPPFVVPWSEASIGGYAIDRVISQVQLARIEARAARLWPPGPYTLGAAAARTTEALLVSARERLCAFTLLEGEFGVRNRIGALPVLLNKRGIADVRTPSLNTRERVLLETSLGL